MAEVATIATAGLQAPALSARLGVRLLLVALVLVAAALGGQFLMGAYSAPVGGYADEPAHYMSGLMLRDYAVSGFSERPMTFAQRYYDHHPTLGIGYWPPAFYVAEALWMLAIGISRSSVLLLCALVSAVLQFLLFRDLNRRLATVPALLTAASFPFLPAVRYSISLVMTDVFVALACFGATLQLARFLERPTYRRGMALGLWCSLALLSKLSAAYLVVLAPMAILISRRLDLLRRAATLVPVAVVLTATAPWLYYARKFTTLGVLPEEKVEHNPVLLAWHYILTVLHAAGPLVAAAAVAGLIIVLFGSLRRQPYWAAIAATPLALGVFIWFAPIELEPRHVIVATPALLILSVCGIQWAAGRFLPHRLQATGFALLLTGLLVALVITGPRLIRFDGGFGKTAEYLIANSKTDSVLLVSSTVMWREGAMVAELAQREPLRPGRRTVRSRKLLAEADWNVTYYRQRFETPADMLAALRKINVRHVALHTTDRAAKPSSHTLFLLTVLRGTPDEWREVRRFDGAPGERTFVFSRVAAT